MALASLNVIRLRDQDEAQLPEALAVLLPQNREVTSFSNGVKKTELDDGSVAIDFDPRPDGAQASNKFDANLALDMRDEELSNIANDLLRGYQIDCDSRS